MAPTLVDNQGIISALPMSIKERFNFDEGEMKGANVSPIKRPGKGVLH